MKTELKENTHFEYEDFLNLMWVKITHVGQENIYFEYTDCLGHVYNGYTKYSG